jgi:hypothetical protein
MIQKVNNCWRTLRKKLRKVYSFLSKNEKTVWKVIELVFLIVR